MAALEKSWKKSLEDCEGVIKRLVCEAKGAQLAGSKSHASIAADACKVVVGVLNDRRRKAKTGAAQGHGTSHTSYLAPLAIWQSNVMAHAALCGWPFRGIRSKSVEACDIQFSEAAACTNCWKHALKKGFDVPVKCTGIAEDFAAAVRAVEVNKNKEESEGEESESTSSSSSSS